MNRNSDVADAQLPEYPGTPTSAGSACSLGEGVPPVAPPFDVILMLASGEKLSVKCDAFRSVGFLRHKVKEHWPEASGAGMEVVLCRGERVLRCDFLKIHDVMDGYDDSSLGRIINVIIREIPDCKTG